MKIVVMRQWLFWRNFGGIKLGTGGLVRAYGGVASECLRNAPTCLVKSEVLISSSGVLKIKIISLSYSLTVISYHNHVHIILDEISRTI